MRWIRFGIYCWYIPNARRDFKPGFAVDAAGRLPGGFAAMMLEHPGEAEAGGAMAAAIETLLRQSGPKTRDMGKQAGTADVGNALAEIVGG